MDIEEIDEPQSIANLVVMLFAIQAIRYGYAGNIPSDIVSAATIYKFNLDESVTGESGKANSIIKYYLDYIAPNKDVDGLHRDSKFSPCTPEGIMYILQKEIGDLEGKTALIIGRGKLVGKPLFDMLLQANCTVTMAHSKTKDLESMLQSYDIIIVAAGKPKLVDLSKCNAQIVVDVGVNRVDGKLCGDCYNFNETSNSDMLVTPVPKGIGLMTRAMLIKHIAEKNKEVMK